VLERAERRTMAEEVKTEQAEEIKLLPAEVEMIKQAELDVMFANQLAQERSKAYERVCLMTALSRGLSLDQWNIDLNTRSIKRKSPTPKG
jgi:predicted methyltransferase MtxX (methanogen marker protein 4)